MSVNASNEVKTKLRVGDKVMIITGGNSKSGKKVAGEVGELKKFLPKKNRAIVEGQNMVVRHKRAHSTEDESGRITKEGSVHISNLMFFSEKLSKPVRLKTQKDDSGKVVRGFNNPDTGEFEKV